MSARRFEVSLVSEPKYNNSSGQPSEIIPLIHIENEVPPPPPLPASISSINGKDSNRTPPKLFSTILQRKSFDIRRRATMSAALASLGNQIKKTSSFDILHKTDSTSSLPHSKKFISGNEIEELDNYDSNPIRTPNKFLQELRLKRRELLDKAKYLTIDQRIAFHRRANQQAILRAQDIFDVHFELNPDDNNYSLSQANLFTEESQEKIRNDIYNELNRQRMKQYHKHHRHLFLGRALLMFMTSLLVFMSFTLIYAVLDLYDRASYLDVKLPNNEVRPMIIDKETNFY